MDHYLHHDLGILPLLWCFFAHLLILEYPDHHQNLISSLLYYPGPLHKILSQSIHNFLSNVVHGQTDKYTNRQTNTTKNITSFTKEVMMPGLIHDNSASWTSCYFLLLHIFRSHTSPICFWNGHKSFPVNCVGIICMRWSGGHGSEPGVRSISKSFLNHNLAYSLYHTPFPSPTPFPVL